MSSVLLELADNLTDRRGAVLRIDGYNLPWLSISTQPTGLLGIRFGPPVEAVAVRLGAGPVLAVHRSGEAMVIGSTDPSRAACADDASLVLDLARRSLGLPMAAPDGVARPSPASHARRTARRPTGLGGVGPPPPGCIRRGNQPRAPPASNQCCAVVDAAPQRSRRRAGSLAAGLGGAGSVVRCRRSGPLRLRPATGDRHHAR